MPFRDDSAPEVFETLGCFIHHHDAVSGWQGRKQRVVGCEGEIGFGAVVDLFDIGEGLDVPTGEVIELRRGLRKKPEHLGGGDDEGQFVIESELIGSEHHPQALGAGWEGGRDGGHGICLQGEGTWFAPAPIFEEDVPVPGLGGVGVVPHEGFPHDPFSIPFEGSAGESHVGHGFPHRERLGVEGKVAGGGVADVDQDALPVDAAAGQAQSVAGIDRAGGRAPFFNRFHCFLHLLSGVDDRFVGFALEDVELQTRRGTFQAGEFLAQGIHQLCPEDAHGGRAVQHHRDLLGAGRLDVTGLHQEPGEQEHHQELEPERDGIGEPVEAPAAHGLALSLSQQKKGADRDHPGLTLQEVNQDDGGNSHERPKTGGIGEDEIHAELGSARGHR